MTGRLVVVGTPIGNLGDLSPRARQALADADVIACEDTRRTGRLLDLVGIEKTPMVVANDHTERSRLPAILERLDEGAVVALVTDAGMPAVSDPGSRIVAGVVARGHDVEVVPGPTAVTAAVAISGLVTGPFVFQGFLARKGADRSRQLTQVAGERRPVVIYESPKRVVATLADLRSAAGPDRAAVVARELTKLHEEVVRGTLAEVHDAVAASEPRGEFVIVVAGLPEETLVVDDDAVRDALAQRFAAGATTRDAVAEVAAATGVAKRRVYDIAVAMR